MLAVCAIFKDEGPYLGEWIEFHRMQGVERFYLYDHESSDESLEVAAPYVDAGLVDLERVTGESPQLPCYSRCILHHPEADWIAFIDIDEFLFSPEGRPLPEVLAAYSAYPGVVVNWAVYGDGGHLTQPSQPVTSAYLQRAESDHPINEHVKSIVQPRRTHPAPLVDPHSFFYIDGARAVNERFEPVAGPFNKPPSHNVLRVNHYWSKSIEEAKRKASRPRADCNQGRTPWEQLTAPEFSAVYDPVIQNCPTPW